MSAWKYIYAAVGGLALLGTVLLVSPVGSTERQANEPQGVVIDTTCELPLAENEAGMIDAGFEFDHSWGKEKIIEFMTGLRDSGQIDQGTFDSYMVVDEIQFWSHKDAPGFFRVIVVSDKCIEVFFDISEPVQEQLELEFIYGIKGVQA